VHIYLKAELDVETDALVDSGATKTFIPYEIAEAIGLLPEYRSDLRTGETRAASSKFPTYIVSLPLLKVI
jgi:predicted aspartyl protease